MEILDFYKQLSIDMSLADRLNYNPYYNCIASDLKSNVIIHGQEFIDLASNNYLGLAGDIRVKQAILETVDKYGASMCGTPIATGYADIFRRVEHKLSEFVGLEAATIFPSCYQANTGLFSKIAGKEDLIIIDHYAHASLIEGVRSVGCKMKPFLHNNMQHLQGILERSSSFRQIFVVTESVFSTEGSIAPFDEIVELCHHYNAIPIIDDSHGIGVIGKNGKGILEEKGIVNFNGIYTASLGKALANSGGMIAGKKELIDYLRYSCSSLIYSTALPPAILGGIEIVLEIIENDFPSLSKKLWHSKSYIRHCLKKYGFNVTNGEAPITSIICGDLEATIKMAKSLFEQKILSTPFVPPSVPPKQGRVRLIAGADLNEHDRKKIMRAFSVIKDNKINYQYSA